MRYVDTGKNGNPQLDSILNTVFNPEADRGAPSGIGEFVYQPFGGLTAAAWEARSGNREKMDRYNRAWGMRQSGVPDRQIYDQTGWFVGEDGMWRFGFDSGKMKIDQRAVLASHTTGAKTSVDKVKFKREDNSDVYIPIIGQMSLGEIVRFPELFIDYPELRKIPVFTIPDSEARAFGFSGLWIPNRGKQREWFNKNLYHINPIGAI